MLISVPELSIKFLYLSKDVFDMATNRMVAVAPGSNLGEIVNNACQNLTAQWYQVNSQMLSPVNAIVTVSKDRDNGLKNFIGLGLEAKANITILNDSQLSISVDSEWTNKIIALVVG